MITKETEVFALDMGNGWIKARNRFVTYTIPAQIAKVKDLGTGSIDDMSIINEGLNVYKSKLDDGVEYVMGEHIRNSVQSDKLRSTYRANKRYEYLNYKLMVEFILAQLTSDVIGEKESVNAIVITGMPSNEIGSKEELELKKLLFGKHLIVRNDKELIVNIIGVNIMEQPLGSVYDVHMNDEYKVTKEINDTITVFDFGSGTVIMDTFKGRRRLENLSDTIMGGQFKLYETVKDAVIKEFGTKTLTTDQIEEAFKDNFTYKPSKREETHVNFKEIAMESIKDQVDQWVSRIDAKLTDRNVVDQFILTGGGVHNVKNIFKKAFDEKTIYVVENPQHATVNGFYKFGNAIKNKQLEKVMQK